MKMAEISNEPTMEDILSSIKKIISDDSAKTLSAPRQRRAPVRDEEVSDAPPAAEDADGVADSDTVELISPVVASASKTALDQLSALVVKPEITGTDTLEGMVREMLRPMMKDWLDANLPRIVEAMVAREISRISNK
jgi:uncharacterized protein